MRIDRLRIMFLIAANDFKMTVRDRGVLIWIFAMPVVFMLVFGLAFRGGARGSRKARLTVENADTGFVARALIDELRTEAFEVVDTLRSGQRAIRALVIPAGFTEGILGRSGVVLTYRKDDDADVQANEAARAAIYRSIIRLVSRLVEIEADALEARTNGFALAGDSLAGSLLAAARGRPGILDSVAFHFDSLRAVPPIVTVRTSSAGNIRRIPSGFQASVPGNLVMFVLMSMVFSGAVITVERSTGVLRRYAYAPVSKTTILLGKLLGRMLIALVQIVFLLLVGKYAFRISLGESPGSLVFLMVLFAFCTGAFGVFFGSLFRNPEQVSAISIVTTLAMAALGGCWWSLELVPRTFQIVSLFFPTGWMMDGIHRIISFGYGMSAIVLDAAMLAAFGIVFVLLASWRLRLAD